MKVPAYAGTYSYCRHFRDQLIERIGAETKYCKEHKVMLRGETHIAVHFGRVHGLVEDFLPSRYHIALKSPRLARPKARNSGALEKTDKDANRRHWCLVRANPLMATPPWYGASSANYMQNNQLSS